MPAIAPTTTLTTIQQKVRRLTRSPSTSQLSTSDLNQYINTFVVYDFPEHLRMFNLRVQFTFVCNPFQDTYSTDIISFAGANTNSLYDFQNKYISVHEPLYIAGYQSFYSQSREQFFGIYPLVNNIASIGFTGDGVATIFTGVVNSQQAFIPNANFQQTITLLQNNVLFDSVDSNGIGLSLVDVPLTDPTTGFTVPIGNLYAPGTEPVQGTIHYPADLNPFNTINYVTGVFTITFPRPPATGSPINSQTVPQVVSLPQGMLFFDDKFTLRPVPDQPYRVNFEAYARPTFLMNDTDSPALNEWWQYVSYGAALKILQDRMDLESVNLIMPEYKRQEALCLRRTIVQLTNERVSTIYTEQTSFGPGSGAWGWGGGPF